MTSTAAIFTLTALLDPELRPIAERLGGPVLLVRNVRYGSIADVQRRVTERRFLSIQSEADSVLSAKRRQSAFSAPRQSGWTGVTFTPPSVMAAAGVARIGGRSPGEVCQATYREPYVISTFRSVNISTPYCERSREGKSR